MNKINYLKILGFAVLYVVTVFATAFQGYLSPYAWVFFPVIAALLGALLLFGCREIVNQKNFHKQS